MKKLLVLFVAATMAMPMLNSCKKGENDPAISLKSRKARLTAEWTLTEGQVSTTSGGTTSITTYNGTTVSYGTGTPAAYTEKYTFESDGTYVHQVVSGADSETWEGNWYFGGKMKDQDVKAGETVVLVPTKYTEVSGGATSLATFEGAYAGAYSQTLTIDQLKSNELVIKLDGSYTSGTVQSRTGTLTFENK